jgi:UDP-N-acetylmuramyl pentapeptide phosphotransferase/UDP-N-acetylglucosamine-1-phosphate transferase
MTVTAGSVVLVPALAGLVAWRLVGLMSDLSRRRGWLDLPNDRSLHTNPTPRLGGVGILVAVLVAGGAAWLFAPAAAFPLPLVLIGSSIAAISLADDLRGLPVTLRFAVHVGAAVLAVRLFGPIDAVTLNDASALALGWAAVPLTVMWIVGFINAFNFMDGIDGLAGGQAMIAGLAWTAIGWATGQTMLAALGATLAASSFGFLLHNWAPARIFMGDAGSAFLGFVLSTLPLVAAPPRNVAVPAVLVVWPFVFDATFTLLRRLSRGENVFAAHRSHLYQRLTQAGWSHARVTRLYMALAAAGAGLALAVTVGALPAAAGLAVAGGAAAGLWRFVVLTEGRARGTTGA